MTQDHSATYARKTARQAGALYLLIAVFGGFSIGYVPSVIVATGDAAQTAHNMAGNIGLYRASLFADIVVILCEIVLTVLLYQLLKPVGQTWSMIAALARFSMVLVMSVNLMLNLAPVILLQDAETHMAFDVAQTQSLALLFFELHQFGVYVWGVLFGLHMTILGWLVIRSGFFPRFLGWLMAIGSFGYIIEGIAKITLTQSTILSGVFIGLLTIVTIGELSFAIWLLFKGVNTEIWKQSTLKTT